MQKDPYHITQLNRYRRPLPYALLWSLPLIIVLAGCWQLLIALKYHNKLAPAPISGSICMDSKIEFLRHHPVSDTPVIIAGSSIGTYSLDSQVLSDRLGPNERFLNISAWGRTAKQTFDWLQLLLADQSPRVVIMPCSLSDFRVQTVSEQKDYDPLEVKKSLNNPDSLLPNITHFDPVYYLKRAYYATYPGDSADHSLQVYFDAFGSQSVPGRDWSHQARWNKLGGANLKHDPEQYRTLHDIADWLAKKNCTLIVIQAPMRLPLVAKHQDVVNKHLDQLAGACDYPNIIFLNAHDRLQLPDIDFLDGIHLNQTGAIKVTQYLLENWSPHRQLMARQSPQKHQDQTQSKS